MDKKALVFALILLALLSAVALASNDIPTAQEQNQDSFSRIDNNTEEGPATDLLWRLIPTIIIAGAAVTAIGFSWYATRAVRKAAQGELITQITNTYGSPEMLEAMMGLVWWVDKKEEEGEDWLETFEKKRNKRVCYPDIEKMDKYRRKFLNHYEAFNILKGHGLLSEKIVKDLRSENQELFYKRIVGPLTDRIKPKITKEWPKRTVNYQKVK